jgi:hypothetical protein
MMYRSVLVRSNKPNIFALTVNMCQVCRVSGSSIWLVGSGLFKECHVKLVVSVLCSSGEVRYTHTVTLLYGFVVPLPH